MKTYTGATGDLADVTPHDTNALRTGDNSKVVPTRTIYIGTVTAGQTITVITAHGQTITFYNPAQGVCHPWAVTHVKSIGTNVTDIRAGW